MPVDILERGPFPNTVYKFRYFDPDGFHIDVLENTRLWFSEAAQLNDPFDTKIDFDIRDSPPGVLKQWVMSMLEKHRPNLSTAEQRELGNRYVESWKEHPELILEFNRDHHERVNSRFGICSLSGVRDNLLLWAHYANYHTGFCVGFDVARLSSYLARQYTEESILITLERISYEQYQPQINIAELRSERTGAVELLQMLCTKSRDWAYEREYRLLFGGQINTTWEFDSELINEVILGCRISESNKNRILKILNVKGCGARVFQAHKHSSKFELVFEEVLAA